MSNEKNDKPKKLPTRRVPMVKIVNPTDAVDLTLSIMPNIQRIRLAEEVGKRYKEAKREAWRKRNSDPMYALTSGRYRPKLVSEMSDAEVDEAMKWDAIAARQAPPPTISNLDQMSPYNMSEQERHMYGYYTDAEREKAAKMNLMRSSTAFGSVMPNFGTLFAYNNPAAEFDAFGGTTMYATQILDPIAFPRFTIPIRTAKNVGLAVYNTAKIAVPAVGRYVTNPRTVAASLALGATTAPVFAYTARESENNGNSWGIIGPIALGLGLGYGAYRFGKWRGKKKAATSGSTPETTTTQFYGYDPETRPNGWLFAWENPKGARSRFNKKHPDNRTEVINEWNSALDDESKKAFKDKYKLYTEKEGGARDYLDDEYVKDLLNEVDDFSEFGIKSPIINPYANKVWINATPNLVRAARWRNAGRALNWGIIGAGGYGLYNMFSGSPTTIKNDSTTTNDTTSIEYDTYVAPTDSALKNQSINDIIMSKKNDQNTSR